MATEFIPFAQMTAKEKREHLIRAHGLDLEPGDNLPRLHTDDHRTWDGVYQPVPHTHTKVARRTKR